MKFYTEAGNWDLVGNNTPVFFVRDPYKFPDFIRTQKRDPKTDMRSATAVWDFWSLSQEGLHQVTVLFSDRDLPKSYRTYSFINAAIERCWVKFHLKTMQGIATLTNAEAAGIVGEDRESHRRDLFEAIERANYPKWRLCVQIMPEADPEKTLYNPFDLTKVWLYKDYPLIEVGIVELNRNPRTTSPWSNRPRSSRRTWCRVLAFRPTRCCSSASLPTPTQIATGSVRSIIRTSRSIGRVSRRAIITRRHDALDENGSDSVNYEPNSFGGPVEDHAFKEPPLSVSRAADRYDDRIGTTASLALCSG